MKLLPLFPGLFVLLAGAAGQAPPTSKPDTKPPLRFPSCTGRLSPVYSTQ